MTFLELQKKIVQTRKNRKGVKNRVDYFANDVNESFYMSLYKKALNAANQIVKHCDEKGEIEPFVIVWGKPQKEKERELEQKYLDLLADTAKYEKWWKESAAKLSKKEDEVIALKEKIRALESALKKSNIGGRHKDKAKEDNIVTYKLANPTSSVKDIADALGVSTTTVQRALVANGLNKKRKK